MSVRLCLIDALQNYIKHNPLPNVVRMSELTTLDFEKLGSDEIGEDMYNEIREKGAKAVLEEKGIMLNGVLKLKLKVIVDDTVQSGFVFECHNE